MSKIPLNVLGAPSRQIYEGPIEDENREDRWRWLRGQITPENEQALLATHGRWLSGLGTEEPMSSTREFGEHPPEIDTYSELYNLEGQDDVLGSGVFDDPRRPATSNPETGVFESHYSLPGYQARQVPFKFSNEIVSLPNGAAYIEVPAGGMAYVERDGRHVWPDRMGPQPAGIEFAPPLPTGRMQPYAYLERAPRPVDVEDATPINRPARDTGSSMVPVGQAAPSPYYHDVSGLGTSRQPQYSTRQLPTYPQYRQMPMNTVYARVPLRNHLVTQGGGWGMGNGEGEKPTSLVTYAVVGLALGAVGYMVFGGGSGRR